MKSVPPPFRPIPWRPVDERLGDDDQAFIPPPAHGGWPGSVGGKFQRRRTAKVPFPEVELRLERDPPGASPRCQAA